MSSAKMLYLVPTQDPDGPGGVKSVRDPQRNFQRVPPEGTWVTNDAYWQAQLRDGAVKEGTPPPQ